jgi:hypothetical protein
MLITQHGLRELSATVERESLVEDFFESGASSVIPNIDNIINPLERQALLISSIVTLNSIHESLMQMADTKIRLSP